MGDSTVIKVLSDLRTAEPSRIILLHAASDRRPSSLKWSRSFAMLSVPF